MVRAWIVSHGDDEFAMPELIERDGAFADTNGHGQADTGGLVTHIRAIWKIVCAVFTAEELVEEGSFVGSATRGVELHHVRIRQTTKDLPDAPKCFIPADRLVGVAGTIINQRLG